MRVLFVMDPAESMLPDKDTSFALMRGALARGHQTLHSRPIDVFNRGREVFAQAREIRVSDAAPHVTLGATADHALAELDAVFIRKDPPFDSAYAHLTQQLDLVKDQTLVINDPRGLRDANEKLLTFHFAEFMPDSLVTSSPARILDFVAQVGGRAVLKPLDGAGGSGVVALTTGDANTRALVDLLTREGKELALVQRFLPDVRTGDKRVIMLDGEPLGAILRVPRDDDFRANIHVGGSVRPTELTPKETALVHAVGPRLREHGLYFVGLDLIAEHLIEVNVTSPTGIQELGRFQGRPTEQDVIAWAEQRVAARG
ncbi:MAG: glutathione synthase [Polyangiaceae bacterium]|nr:glutathione synthase [Polyangiaceae bacterium]